MGKLISKDWDIKLGFIAGYLSSSTMHTDGMVLFSITLNINTYNILESTTILTLGGKVGVSAETVVNLDRALHFGGREFLLSNLFSTFLLSSSFFFLGLLLPPTGLSLRRSEVASVQFRVVQLTTEFPTIVQIFTQSYKHTYTLYKYLRKSVCAVHFAQ